MCCDRGLFTNFIKHEEVRFEENKSILAKGKDDKNVLYSPQLTMNFASIAHVVSNGLILFFDVTSAVIKNARDRVLLIIESKVEKLFVMTNMRKRWHNRLGHLNYNAQNDRFRREMVKGMNLKDGEHVDQCKTCMYSRIHVQPFPQETSKRTEDLLEVIHSNVCGPFNVKS